MKSWCSGRRAVMRLSVALMFFLNTHACSQMRAEETVNPATGEMNLPLPLATLKGRRGHDYSVSLNYEAGIKLKQEASPVGLGFSIYPGAISRKVVFVPDECSGGTDNIEHHESTVCTDPPWLVLIEIAFSLVGMILLGYYGQQAGYGLASCISTRLPRIRVLPKPKGACTRQRR